MERCRPEAAVWTFAKKAEPCKVFVKRVPAVVKKSQLRAAFKTFGAIKDIRIVNGFESTSSKRRDFYNAFIEYEDEASAQASIAAMDGKSIDSSGAAVSVSISDPSSRKIA